MRRFALSLLLSISSILPTLAPAQTIEPGDVVLSGDPAGSQWAIPVTGFSPFEFYVVGFDLAGGVTAFEWGLLVPPSYTLLSFELVPPRTTSVNIGSPTNVIVSLGCCADGSGAVPLARYFGGFFLGPVVGPDELFCLSAAEPSSFDPPRPGYVQCDFDFVPFGVAQTGFGIYPDGCLVVNPTASPGCPELEWLQDVDDVLVPAGGTCTVPYRILERVVVSGTSGRIICTFPSFTRVRFTLSFDPSILDWAGARLPARYAGFPLTATELAPGQVAIQLGPNDTGAPLDFYEVPRDLVLLDFVMSPTGGTSRVTFEDAEIFDTDGIVWPLDMSSILLSDDPVVNVEATSFGAVKARY